MSEHDQHVTGHNGCCHPDNRPANESENPRYCERCVCAHDGYCKQLGQWLCEECACLAFEAEITERIGQYSDDAVLIDCAFAASTPRTNSEGLYTSVDFEIACDPHSVSFDELAKIKANKEK